MKKLIALGILAAIPIGLTVYAYVIGGFQAAATFWAVICGAVLATPALIWAANTLGNK